jgi:hypothetical protein
MFRLPGRRLAVFLLCIPAFPVFGQTAIPPHRTPRPVTPIPAYTAEFKTVNVRTLANGTTITTETREMDARDSQGRSFFSSTRTPSAPGVEVTNGNIENPVDNTRIMWNSHDKKASVIRLPAQDQRHGCWASASGSYHFTIRYGGETPPPNTTPRGVGEGSAIAMEQVGGPSSNEWKREELGTTTIQGLEAQGKRLTIVIPAGQMGNDNPITTTREMWRAPGFPFLLREAYDDPRTGKRTRETVSLTIGEPDLSMFQPPEGYEVVNEEMHEVPCQQ